MAGDIRGRRSGEKGLQSVLPWLVDLDISSAPELVIPVQEAEL
jgi:hypothetical protein